MEAVLARFILINRYFYPDEAATSRLAMGLSLALTTHGWTVDVITSRQLYDNPASDLPANEEVRGIRIHRLWTTRMGRGRLAGRAFDYLAFYASAFGWLVRQARRGDVILALTDPPLISVLAAAAGMLRGCVQINWLHDLFPEIAQVTGVLPRGWIYRTLLSLRNWSLRRAAANVVIGDGMAQHLLRHGVPHHRIVVIHNWSNGAAVAPVSPERNRLRAEWGLSEKFVAGYSGNLGRVHDYKTIIEAAEVLRNDPEVRFLFIGGGHFIKSLETEANRRALANIIIKPYQHHSCLSESLSVPDLHLISLLPMLEGLVVPSKFYGIAAAGRPSIFIGKRSGEIPQLLRTAKCGTAVATGDGIRLARYIKRLQKNDVLRALWGQNARAVLDLHFDERLGLARWLDLIQSLTAKPAASPQGELRLLDTGLRAANGNDLLQSSAPAGFRRQGRGRRGGGVLLSEFRTLMTSADGGNSARLDGHRRDTLMNVAGQQIMSGDTAEAKHRTASNGYARPHRRPSGQPDLVFQRDGSHQEVESELPPVVAPGAKIDRL